MALSEKLIDKRILRRSLEKGEVSEVEYESYLTSLPDTSGNLEQASTDGPAPAPEPAGPVGDP